MAVARPATMLLFGTLAVLFCATPLVYWLVAGPLAAPMQGRVALVELGLIVPAAAFAALAQRAGGSRLNAEISVLLGIAAVGIGLLLLTTLWRRAGVPFPAYFLSLFVSGAMVMTGLRSRWLLPLGASLLAANTLLGYHLSGWSLAAHFGALGDLASAVTAGVACLHLRAAQRAQWLNTRKREREALEDPLTGLANRRAFLRQAERALAQARRDEQPLTLAIIDLDRFKRLNDRHGHAAGDAALVSVANELAACARRPLDAAVRLGGDEFVVLWFGVGSDDAKELCDTLVRKVRCRPLRAADGSLLEHPAISLGAVSGAVTTDLRIDDLLLRADLALYEAKRAGGNAARLHALPPARAQDSAKSRSRA